MDADVQFRGRVLVADDNEDLRELMALQLAKLGVHVLLARDGAEALSVTRRETPDLILLDIEMPIIDGLEVARKLRASGFTGKIVAVSAHGDDKSLERMRAAGCDASVNKPVTLEELRAVLTGRLAPAV